MLNRCHGMNDIGSVKPILAGGVADLQDLDGWI
jgi:hypothetical protein